MTVQMPERLRCGGGDYQMRTIVLPSTFASDHELERNGMMRSDCWRGCVGSWEIEDGVLYLTGVEFISFNPKTMVEMFGRDKVPADWFSGTLECDSGELLGVSMMGAVFEKTTKFTVEQGKITNIEEHKNEAPQKP